MASRSRVEFEERDYYSREPSRQREREDDIEIRVRDRERDRDRDRLPSFLREERRSDAGQMVLRQREVETTERVRRRSPSPLRVQETRIMRARSVSPLPPRRTEEDVRFRTVERVREPSRGPVDRIRSSDIETLRTRIIERDRERSPSPSPERVIRTRIIDRERSPSPVRERIRIVERESERERPRLRTPSPSPPPVIKGPVIEREVITHYRDIDHGVVSVRAPSPPPPRRKERERDTEIDIYTSRNETEVDIHKHSRSHSRNPPRGRSPSRSRERVSRPHVHTYDDELFVQTDRDRKHLQVDIEERHSSSRGRRAHSEAPYRESEESREAREITSRIDARGRMGEARNGITKDWTIVDVPPGTERVRMDGAGGASAEVTWQKYSGVRRSKFIPDRDDRATAVSSSTSLSLSDREVSDSRRGSRLSVQIYDKEGRGEKDREIDVTTDRRISLRPQHSPASRRSETWTEITKDLVLREAIDELGYEYEETEWFFYVMTYLKYEDVLQLVQLSDAIRRARKDHAYSINWERQYMDDYDKEYHLHSRSHYHDGGRRRRYDDERTVEREVTYESRGSGGGYR